MKRSGIRAVLVAAGLLALAACGTSTSGSSGNAAAGGAVSGSSSSSASAPAAVLKTANSAFGQIVVDAQGRTVYFFAKDTANSGTSACTGSCVGLWPAVTTTSDSPAVDGVTGTVGTITLADGSKQVTINGLPVYRFSGDTKAGDTSGQLYQNLWWVVSPSGAKITTAPMQDSGSTPVY
jgi:predicted lipoprotein with Yx(FWY)xxD motif